MNGTAPVPAAVMVVQRPTGVPTLKPPHAELADSLAVAYALEPVITGVPLDPLAAFAELGRMKLGESDLQAVLGRSRS